MRTAIPAVLFTMCAWVGLGNVALADDAPRPAPPFTIMRAGAPPLQLSQLKGKVVALVLISTGCPHCQALTTNTLNPLAKEYTPKGVQIVEVAFAPSADQSVPGFIQQYKPTFPVGWSNDPAVRAFLGYSATDQRLAYVPHMVFVDAKGMIRDDFPAESSFFQNPETNTRAELEKLLKPAPATSAGSHAAKKK
ncbi:MAG TPA: TlpA disulfide reductase family protein [Bryobacteraceae bacterium]|nr:TlpA disulfide reductase family protein [Bryobacteraceae bacterium]